MGERPVDFDNEVVKKYLSANFGIPEKMLKDLVLPDVGTEFEIEGMVFRVTYVRGNPFRISAEPVGVIEEKKK